MRKLLNVALAAALTAALVPAGAFAKGFAERPPAEAKAVLDRAERALIDSDFAAASRDLESVATSAPDYAPIYAVYAFAIAQTDASGLARLADIAERYRKLAEAEPDRAAYWYAYGRFQVDRAKREAAFTKVVSLEPSAPWGYLGLGYAARSAGDAAKALPLYEKAHALAPKEPSVSAGLVAAYAAAGKKAEATALMKEVIAAAPGGFWAENAAAAVAATLTEEEAPAFAEFYLQSFPNGTMLGMAYARVLASIAAKDPAAATVRAREALARLTGPARADDRGEIYEAFVLDPALAKGKAAVDALAAEALASAETSPRIFYSLGRFYTSPGSDVAAANRLFALAADLYARSPHPDADLGDELFLAYGQSLAAAGDTAKGAETLERVSPTGDAATRAAAALAGVYGRAGNTAKAFDAATRAAALEPDARNTAALAAAAKAAGRSTADADAAVWAMRDRVAKPAADFTLTSLDGKAVSLASYRGKVVLLNFWFPG